MTMGRYLFLTDHSGVGNPHAKPHAPEYAVEHLNRLMVRMIAQQLAGGGEVGRRAGIDTHASERELEQLANIGFVVDNQCQWCAHKCVGSVLNAVLSYR